MVEERTEIYLRRRERLVRSIEAMASGEEWACYLPEGGYVDTTQAEFETACKTLASIDSYLRRQGIKVPNTIIPQRDPLKLRPPWEQS